MMQSRTGPPRRRLPHGMTIIHEDRDILVVDKPHGLLTMSTETEKTRTAYHILTDYVRKGDTRSKKRLFIVHRLDRETSGILVFAKHEDAKQSLQGGWDETKKTYLAVVHGTCATRADTITSYLVEHHEHRVYSTPDPTAGKLSHTAYTVLKETSALSLLEVDLLTGRKHQIRVHLAEQGHPVVGDQKYGTGKTPYTRLALHALSITIRHPGTGAMCTYTTTVPDYFTTLVGSIAQQAQGTLRVCRE